jgi:hypothetical protein
MGKLKGLDIYHKIKNLDYHQPNQKKESHLERIYFRDDDN